MRDLATLIREHYDGAVEPVEAAEIFARFEAELQPQSRRLRPLMVAGAAALGVFVIAGALALLGLFGSTDEVVDEPVPTSTTLPASTTLPTYILPESSVPAPIDHTFGIAVAGQTLWASTEAGIVRWDLETREATLFAPGEDLPFAQGASGLVAVAPDGTIWASTWNGDLARFDGIGWSEPAGYDQLDIVNPRCIVGDDCENPITAIAVGPDGHLSLAIGPETLLQYDGVDWDVVPVTPAETLPDGVSAWTGSMAIAADGTLWADSREGLLEYDGDAWTPYNVPDGLASGRMTSLAVAPNGDVWAGTSDLGRDGSGGVARFDGDSWTVFDETDGLYESSVTAIAVGPDGTVWAVHGALEDTGLAESPASGGVSWFDGARWSSTTIADVGFGFGWGNAAVDDTGTLWTTSFWGVVGFDGKEQVMLRVPEGTRPVIEAPHVVIEGGEDILATTIAEVAPPIATCPVGSDPDRPGPVDQARPNQVSHMVMDRQSGRIVATGDSGGAMGIWVFDVCTNTWTLQTATRSVVDAPGLFVYDADSDIVVAIGAFVDTYDVDTDTWERLTEVPFGFDGEARAVYDPISGLVVVRVIASSKMWAYDVDTDNWTPIRQGPISPPTAYSSFGHVHAYDANADRLVLYLADSGARAPITWTYDLRAGEWSIEETLTPDLAVGAFAQPSGKAAYDEAAQLTVITSADGEVVGYDAARHEWELLWADSGEANAYGVATGLHARFNDQIVYDPINGRIVVIGGTARMPGDGDKIDWVDMNDVWAFDTATGTWSELLATTTIEPASTN